MRFTVVVVVALVASPVLAGPCDELCRDRQRSLEREYSEFQADNRARETDRRLRGIEDEVRKLRSEQEWQRINDDFWNRPRRR